MDPKMILVANSHKAKLYKVVHQKIESFEASYNADDFNIKAERQGLRQGFFQKSSSPPSFFDPHTTFVEIERMKFCKRIAEELDTLYHNDKIKELLIIAEPKTLGTIRRCLKLELKRITSLEVAKDLVQSEVGEIESNIVSANKAKHTNSDTKYTYDK